MKTAITKTDRLALIGLLTLAARQMGMLEATSDAVCELLGAEKGDGHCGDAVYDSSRCDADDLLKRLHITVLSK